MIGHFDILSNVNDVCLVHRNKLLDAVREKKEKENRFIYIHSISSSYLTWRDRDCYCYVCLFSY